MYPTIKMLAPPRRRAGRSRARGLGRSGEMAAARAQGAGPRERRRLNEREGRVTRQEVHPEGDSPQTFCRPGRWQPALPVWTSMAPVLPGAWARPAWSWGASSPGPGQPAVLPPSVQAPVSPHTTLPEHGHPHRGHLPGPQRLALLRPLRCRNVYLEMHKHLQFKVTQRQPLLPQL